MIEAENWHRGARNRRKADAQFLFRLYNDALDRAATGGELGATAAPLAVLVREFQQTERRRRDGADVGGELGTLRAKVVAKGFTWGVLRQVALRRMKTTSAQMGA